MTPKDLILLLIFVCEIIIFLTMESYFASIENKLDEIKSLLEKGEEKDA